MNDTNTNTNTVDLDQTEEEPLISDEALEAAAAGTCMSPSPSVVNPAWCNWR
jgi:hypothetical protein